MEIEHFAHEHPLILFEGDPDPNLWCIACGRLAKELQDSYPLVESETSFYKCNILGCKYYFLHKTCAQLPLEIQHPLHPHDHHHHPLTLLSQVPHNCKNQSCNCCGDDEPINFFTYHCYLCQYNLDVLCALPIALNFDYKSHQHPLTPLRRIALLFCDACGTEHRGFFYTCPTCITKSHSHQFFIHQNCASLSKTFQHNSGGHDDHNHDLILGYSIPPDYARHFPRCKICLKTLDPKYWVYYCGGCRYFLHINCATTSSLSNKETETKTKTSSSSSIKEAIHLPLHESISLVSRFLKNAKLENTQRAKTLEFNHFSHEHPLILFDDQSEDEDLCYGSKKLSLLNEIKDDKICSGCIQHISNSPFYSCSQCDVFLHKCCAELPTMLEKPCTRCQHQLKLVAKASTPFNLFRCDCCRIFCNGFAYHCTICDFYLDVKCGFLPSAITHEAHHPQHIIQLTDESCGDKCSSCGYFIFDDFAYGCNICKFNLHIRCALFPCTIRQKYDELHLFTLRYSPIKNHRQEYICEVCEKDLDPDEWFYYHCVECDKSIHIECTYVGDLCCNVKFGGIFHTDHHEHQLTLVHKTKKPSICDSCEEDIKCDFVFHADSTLECSQCNFKIHLKCAL